MSSRAYLIAKAERDVRDGRKRDSVGAFLGTGAVLSGGVALESAARRRALMSESRRSASVSDGLRGEAKDYFDRDPTMQRHMGNKSEIDRRLSANSYDRHIYSRGAQMDPAAKQALRDAYRTYLKEGSEELNASKHGVSSRAQDLTEERDLWRRDAYSRARKLEGHPRLVPAVRSAYGLHLNIGSTAHRVKTGNQARYMTSQPAASWKARRDFLLPQEKAQEIMRNKKMLAENSKEYKRLLNASNDVDRDISARRNELRPWREKIVTDANRLETSARDLKTRAHRHGNRSKGALVAAGALGAGFIGNKLYRRSQDKRQ